MYPAAQSSKLAIYQEELTPSKPPSRASFPCRTIRRRKRSKTLEFKIKEEIFSERPSMAMVSTLAKDSRWLQLEVCREHQRNKCTRPDVECKFAHPASTVDVQNGRVVACYDSIKVIGEF